MQRRERRRCTQQHARERKNRRAARDVGVPRTFATIVSSGVACIDAADDADLIEQTALHDIGAEEDARH